MGSEPPNTVSEKYVPLRREYSKLALKYDRRWDAYVRRSVAETLRRLDVRSGDRVLDVGCGTGVLLKELSLAEPGAELFGVDATPEMLDVGCERLGPKAELVSARAEKIPFPDEHFDIVVSTSAFHFVREPRTALAEMYRVLKPSGKLVITDWCSDFLQTRLLDAVFRIASRSHERAYDSARMRKMMEDTGFRDVRIDKFEIGVLWGMMAALATK